MQINKLFQVENSKKVITYGTFDLFHKGHDRILKRAKALGDTLYVGVSTDQFNKIKGKTCHQSYDERVSMMLDLPYIDFIFPECSWDQKTIDITKYGIDIFVMGDDWEGKFDYLTDYCKVMYLQRTQGISSTILRKSLLLQDMI